MAPVRYLIQEVSMRSLQRALRAPVCRETLLGACHAEKEARRIYAGLMGTIYPPPTNE